MCVVGTVTSYAQYLKGCYREPLPDDEKLLENIGKIYIELAVIRNENISREESENLVKLNIRGQTDKMLRKRSAIALEDILKPGEDGKPIRRILVEGAPGACRKEQTSMGVVSQVGLGGAR